jgi:hypothetical protein
LERTGIGARYEDKAPTQAEVLNALEQGPMGVSELARRFNKDKGQISHICQIFLMRVRSSVPTAMRLGHCRICQKAYGQTSGIFVAFEKGDLELTSGSPKFYKSSNIAKRGFCAECGSPIIFSYDTLDAIFVGTLDEPDKFPLNGCHLGIESQISWDLIHDNLPRWRTEDDPEFIAAKSGTD